MCSDNSGVLRSSRATLAADCESGAATSLRWIGVADEVGPFEPRFATRVLVLLRRGSTLFPPLVKGGSGGVVVDGRRADDSILPRFQARKSPATFSQGRKRSRQNGAGAQQIPLRLSQEWQASRHWTTWTELRRGVENDADACFKNYAFPRCDHHHPWPPLCKVGKGARGCRRSATLAGVNPPTDREAARGGDREVAVPDRGPTSVGFFP
jgi:hypothetical protein